MLELFGSRWITRDPELGEGNSLAHYLSANGPLPEHKARYVFGQLVEALHYLDSIGVSHGDIKPCNVLIDVDLKVRGQYFPSCSSSIHC